MSGTLRHVENVTDTKVIAAAAADELGAVGAGTRLVHGEVLDPRSLAARAAEVARRQPAPATRTTYAGVYHAFCAALGADAAPAGLNAENVRTWRDSLEARGCSPATIAKHLSALRTLADALGADPQITKVRSQTVARGQPRALTGEEFTRLLRMPDRRTRRGKRIWRCFTCSAPSASDAQRRAR